MYYPGYGHIAPSTSWGRIAAMLYATIGVPLFFVVMANLGRLLTRFIKYLWSYVRKVYYTQTCRRIRHAKTLTNLRDRVSGRKRHTSSTSTTSRKKSRDLTDVDSYVDYEVDDQFNLHPFVAITITVLYIFCGALMYVQWEPWTYLEAFYFIFVSVSTIGFGDLVPEHPKYFLASSVYILLGLSLVAMVINVIMEFFNDTFHKAKQKVGNIGRSIGHNLETGDGSNNKFPSPKSKHDAGHQQDNQDETTEDPFSDSDEVYSRYPHHINRAFSAEEGSLSGHSQDNYGITGDAQDISCHRQDSCTFTIGDENSISNQNDNIHSYNSDTGDNNDVVSEHQNNHHHDIRESGDGLSPRSQYLHQPHRYHHQHHPHRHHHITEPSVSSGTEDEHNEPTHIVVDITVVQDEDHRNGQIIINSTSAQ